MYLCMYSWSEVCHLYMKKKNGEKWLFLVVLPILFTIQNFIVQLQPCSYKGRLLVYTGFFSPYVIFFPHFFRGNIFIFNIILLCISIGIKWPIQKHCVDWLRNPKFDQNLESIKKWLSSSAPLVLQSTFFFLSFTWKFDIWKVNK